MGRQSMTYGAMCVFQPRPIPIICQESGSFSFIPPFVDLAPQPPVRTFGDFRRRFAIPSPNNKRVVFKEHVLGEPSHFQWAAISEDSTALPIFCGQIVAEVQTLSEVEYLRRELEHMTTEKQKLQRALDKAKKLLKATQKLWKAAQETQTNITDFLEDEQDDEDEQQM